MPFISFIIPVYKAERYLRCCVESISRQTFQDYEIILVDDGSPDGSPELCDSLANEISRIQVLHKCNGGAATARNLGLSIARGEYIIFVDADDFWRCDEYLEKLVRQANLYNCCDFISFNCSYFYDSTDSYKDFIPYSQVLAKPVDKDDAIIELTLSGTMPISPCVKLIKRSFLIENDIVFPEGTIMEDVPWFIELLCKSKKVMFLNDYVYAYRQEVSTSVTHNVNTKGINNALTIIEEGITRLDKYNLLTESKNALLSFYAYEVCILLSSYNELEINQKDRLNKLSWLLQYRMNPKVNMVAAIKSLLGLKMTTLVLKLYRSCRGR